jgi:hypothetical protein
MLHENFSNHSYDCWACGATFNEEYMNGFDNFYRNAQRQRAAEEAIRQQAKADFHQYRQNQETAEEFFRRQYEQQWKQQSRQNSSGFHYNDTTSKSASSEATCVISKDLLKRLIMLCHPDKHSGSEMSNAVTKELLAIKEKLK